jgi:hypothetical protein
MKPILKFIFDFVLLSLIILSFLLFLLEDSQKLEKTTNRKPVLESTNKTSVSKEIEEDNCNEADAMDPCSPLYYSPVNPVIFSSLN